MATAVSAKRGFDAGALLDALGRISKGFAAECRHFSRAMRGTLLKASTAIMNVDLSGFGDQLSALRDNDVVKGIASAIQITKEKAASLSSLIKRELIPFFEVVLGSSLIAILPTAGAEALGLAFGLGALAGATLGLLLILVGIVIVYHGLTKYPAQIG